MMYFIPAHTTLQTFPDYFGMIISPTKKRHNVRGLQLKVQSGWPWMCDNGAYTGQFDESLFFGLLRDLREYKSQCVFAVAPDVLHIQADGSVIGDAQGTLDQWPRYAEQIRALGYKAAYVAQDGQEGLPLPDCDALFVGGSTAWKLGAGAVQCIKRAQAAGLWVHVGRVNSLRRLKYFSMLGVDSVDGTKITYAPSKHRKDLIRWMDMARHPLFHI